MANPKVGLKTRRNNPDLSHARISPSQPPATSYHPVYRFEPCQAPRCMQLTSSPTGLCPEHEDGELPIGATL